MKITLLYWVSCYIRVLQQNNIKSWDHTNDLVERGFCYIRALSNEVEVSSTVFWEEQQWILTISINDGRKLTKYITGLPVRIQESAWNSSLISNSVHLKGLKYGRKINCQGLNSGYGLKTGIPDLTKYKTLVLIAWVSILQNHGGIVHFHFYWIDNRTQIQEFTWSLQWKWLP